MNANALNIATKAGYILVDGKLTAYQFKHAILNFANGEVEYHCILGGEEATLKLVSFPDVYANEDAYRRGETIKPETVSLYNAVCDSFYYVGRGLNYTETYCVNNGEVVQCTVPESQYMFDGYICKYIGAGTFYKTREGAMLHCDIIKVDENGVETVIPSVASRVALNEEQSAAVRDLVVTLNRVKELGVRIVVNTENEGFYAFNEKEIKGYDYDCSDNIAQFGGYRINDLMTDLLFSTMVFNTNETSMYVKFE